MGITDIPLKWKCINSSSLVPKMERPDKEKNDVLGMGGQTVSSFETDTSIIQEQQCSGVTECGQKNCIPMGELCGYTVSNEIYNTMPSTQLLPPEAEQTEQHMKKNFWKVLRLLAQP